MHDGERRTQCRQVKGLTGSIAWQADFQSHIQHRRSASRTEHELHAALDLM